MESFRFSYSSLTDYARCQKMYQLKRIQKVPEVPAWWLVAGTAVHSLTEHFDLTGVLLSSTDTADVVTDAATLVEETSGVTWHNWQRTYYDRNRSSKEMIDATCKKVDDAYNSYVSWRMNSDLEILAVEKEVSWEGDGLRFVGFVDRIFTLPDGRVGVVDIKTGKSVPKSDMQLGFYRAALSADTSDDDSFVQPSTGAYWLASTGQLTEWTDLRAWSQQRVQRLGSQLEQGVSGAVFLPNIGDGCRTCPVKQACHAFSGDTELSRQFDPDNPEYNNEASSG